MDRIDQVMIRSIKILEKLEPLDTRLVVLGVLGFGAGYEAGSYWGCRSVST